MCNCKSGKAKRINNLKNQEVLQVASEINSRIISQKQINELDEFDWVELYGVWNLLYPQASQQASQEQVVDDIKKSLQFLKVNYKK